MNDWKLEQKFFTEEQRSRGDSRSFHVQAGE